MKGNIGHPTIASGVAGLIKTVLCLYHEKIRPTLHYKAPNEKIDFESSPFKVVDKLTPWLRSEKRRIAGVSSFGFGGTNVHTILEEAPVPQPTGPSRPQQLLLITAKTARALDRSVQNLKAFLAQNPDTNVADTASTLQRGRRHFAHRLFVVCRDVADAIDVLEKKDPLRSKMRLCSERNPEIAFMFPGQGAQYVKMGKNLYEHEPYFRRTVDTCCNILQPYLKCELRDYLFPGKQDTEKATQSLQNTFFTQPAIFTIEYALAKLLQHWGIQPSAMIGHSVGEFVCGCLAGVFGLEDALRMIALRGKLISSLPPGSMLALRCNADDIEARLPDDIQISAVNSPTLCVISGPAEAVARFRTTLEQEQIPCKRLHTSHAFHSAMMDPIVDEFIDELSVIELKRPQIPFVSTVTADWISDRDATDPVYWGRHLRMPVQFSSGLRKLLDIEGVVLLEVGPRATCSALVRQHFTLQKKAPAANTMSDAHIGDSEYVSLLSALGYLWLHGVTPDWSAFYSFL
jgi:acyl transferase domain-containing protein